MIIGITFIIGVPVNVLGIVTMIIIGGNSFVRAWITEDYDRAAGIGTMIIGMTLKKEREKERERERESAFIGESAMSESMGVEPVASEREKERKKERKRERESAMPESTGV